MGRDINEAWDVAGTESSSAAGGAMLWSRDGTTVVLGGTEGNAINNSGEVAGSFAGATVWTKDGVRLSAPTNDSSVAEGINDRGDVVGVRWDSVRGAPVQAFFWSRSSERLIDLAPGLPFSQALDINDQNEVVGTVRRGAVEEMVIWRVPPADAQRR